MTGSESQRTTPFVTLGRSARTDGVVVTPAARIRSTAMSTRLNRALLSGLRWPLLLLELLVVLAGFQGGSRLVSGAAAGAPDFTQTLAYACLFSSIALGLGSYDRDRRFRPQGVLMVSLAAAAMATLVVLAALSFTQDAGLARATLAYGAAVSLAAVLAGRGLLTWLVSRQPYRFTVLGQSAAVDEVLADLAPRRQGAPHELVPWASLFPDEAAPNGDRLVAAGIAEIVVAPQSISDEEAVHVALLGFQVNIPVVQDRVFYARLLERVPISGTSKRWILEQGIARPQAVVLVLKRVSDIVMAITGLIVLSPLLLAIVILVRLTSPGPVFFVQTRQGRYFRPFEMLKFRTMRHAADVAADTSFARVGDQRVTGIGRILRRVHLDELPQLVNILRGEMSVVGPRPETIEFARRMDEQIPLYELRYLVRPGLTGHAQLKQGYASDTVIDTQTKLSYDLYYLCNYSLRLDLRLLLRTAFFLIRGSR
jgi:exopolysaccharide biosynthesis polyprenyl glycosylphosphotransferase